MTTPKNANGSGRSSAEHAERPGPGPKRVDRGLAPGGARGWAAIYLAAKFQEALVILEADRAAPGAVDRIELIRNRAQAG